MGGDSTVDEICLRRFPEYRLRKALEEMAKSVNKVILLGNAGKDPDIRVAQSGSVIANFSLATTDRVKDQAGNWSDRTEWHNLIAFQRTAEIVRDYVKKGSKLYIEGKIQTRSWDDKNTGEKRYKTEIIVNDISLLSGSTGQGQNYVRDEHSQPASREDYSQAPSGEITDDDIPF